MTTSPAFKQTLMSHAILSLGFGKRILLLIMAVDRSGCNHPGNECN